MTYVITNKQLNERLKSNNLKRYNEGWRATPKRKFGWTPTKAILDSYKPRTKPCKHCDGKSFTLHGMGVNAVAHWACDNCEVLYVARKKQE